MVKEKKPKKVPPKKEDAIEGRKKGQQKGRGYLTINQIEQALAATGGFITYAAKKLNCTHQNITKRIKGSPYLQEVQNSIHESKLDLTEHTLLKQIKEENITAILFFLKCKGRGRGYIERPPETEQTEQPAQPVKVVIEVVDGRKG